MSDSFWTHMLPVLNEQAHATIDANPESLLEHDGGPYGIKAEIIVARLYGMDGEIVQDCVRLNRILPEYLAPIRERLTIADPAESLYPMPRTARYVLQSNYAVTKVAAEYAPPGVELDDHFQFTVLFLRYHRRL